MKHVRQIHLPGAAELASVRARAHAALLSWGKEWGSGWSGRELQDLRVVIPRIELLRAAPHEWLQLGTLWCRWTRTEIVQLGRAVLGGECNPDSEFPDDWIMDVVDQAGRSLARSLSAAVYGDEVEDGAPTAMSAPPPSLFTLGSGAVEISCGSLGLTALATNSVWHSIPPSQRARQNSLPRPVPMDVAARAANARVDVTVGSLEIELRQLLDLRCGDVLQLPTRLSELATVLCEGKPLARAALGVSRGRKAIQLDTQIELQTGHRT